jgi:hypothetical protein
MFTGTCYFETNSIKLTKLTVLLPGPKRSCLQFFEEKKISQMGKNSAFSFQLPFSQL